MRENFTPLGFARKTFCSFIAISAKNAVGIRCAKESSEIRLTARVIPVEFADCPRTKNKNNNLLVNV
jgi:hypothetical protein